MTRRWSPQQMKEFGIVHELIASLVLQCNIFSLKTCGIFYLTLNYLDLVMSYGSKL